jgi:hypothetical protein
MRDACNLCGGPAAVPTTDWMSDSPGFTLYAQPALCDECAPKWNASTRAYRARVRAGLGVEDRGTPDRPERGLMSDALYNAHVNEVARLLVEANEDARVYEQHIDGLESLASSVTALVASGRDWKNDVSGEIHRELVLRGLVEP